MTAHNPANPAGNGHGTLAFGPLIVGPFIREAGSVPGLQEDELLGEHVEQAPIGDADLRDHRQGQK